MWICVCGEHLNDLQAACTKCGRVRIQTATQRGLPTKTDASASLPGWAEYFHSWSPEEQMEADERRYSDAAWEAYNRAKYGGGDDRVSQVLRGGTHIALFAACWFLFPCGLALTIGGDWGVLIGGVGGGIAGITIWVFAIHGLDELWHKSRQAAGWMGGVVIFCVSSWFIAWTWKWFAQYATRH